MTPVLLKPNHEPLRLESFASLALLAAPPALFAAFLAMMQGHSRFAWVSESMLTWPWQVWGMALSGAVALAGGFGDWLFHKRWITVGPNEHRSHLAAMGAGGVVFVLMAAASLAERPELWLVPILLGLIATVALICYDEFVFHRKRCTAFETRLHRMLTHGNGVAFLCWFHWLFTAARAC